jgi:glycosyltransferase involved in cell wall biosynthesis
MFYQCEEKIHKMVVLIPAFNEASGIADVVQQVRQALPGGDVLVVDDGSHDQTASIAAGAGATVVTHPFNMGYGVAIQTGYKYACLKGYEYLAQIDGDGQHDPAFIAELLKPVMQGEADFVIGSRFRHDQSYKPPLFRRLGMLFFRKLVSLFIHTPITDSTSGFQAFNKDVIRFFATDMFPCDYPDADVLIALHFAGFKIQELPVRMFVNARNKSMHHGLKPLYYIFKMLLSIGVSLLRDHRFYRERCQQCQ